MASTALQPRCASANPARTRFDQALRGYADAAGRYADLPAGSTAPREITTGEAVKRALARLTSVRAPDHRSLAAKLRVTLCAAGTPPVLVDALEADVRRLAAGEARA